MSDAPEFGPTIPHLPEDEPASNHDEGSNSCDSLYWEAILEYEKARDAGTPLSASDWIGKWAARSSDLRERLADYLNKAGLFTRLDFYPYSRFRYLGHGGMGIVFQVHDERLGRDAAIKIPLPDRSASSTSNSSADSAVTASDRLREEARIMSRVEHPNIVSVYDMGRLPRGVEGRGESDDLFYTMKLVEGNSTLHDAVQATNRLPETDRRVELRRLLQYVVLVCRAVGFAHSKNVIHRDIKPRNIAVGEYGQVFVLDWGLAGDLTQASADESAETSNAQLGFCGSPGWVAPEIAARAPQQRDRVRETDQLLGDGLTHFEIERQADVYGLGATLYYVILGTSPYSAKSVNEWFELIASREPEWPRQKDPNVPRPLNAICQKAMSRNPRDRYQSAGQLADDLERFLADEPVTAYREGPLELVVRWSRKHKSAVWTGILALLVVVFAFFFYQDMRHQQEKLRSDKLAAEREGRTQNYYQLISRTATRAQRMSAGWIDENLRDLKAAAALETNIRDPAELRSQIAVCLAGYDLRKSGETLHDFRARDIEVIPNSQQLAIACAYGGLIRNPRVDLFDLKSRSVVTTLEVKSLSWLLDSKGHALDDAAVSPNGRFVFGIARGGMLYRWDLSKSPAEMQSIEVPTGKGRIQISPDGRFLAAWSVLPSKKHASSLVMIAVEELAIVTSRTYQELSIQDDATAAHFTPNSKSLAFTTGKGVQLRDVPSLETTIWQASEQAVPQCFDRKFLGIQPQCFEFKSLEVDIGAKLYHSAMGVDLTQVAERGFRLALNDNLLLGISESDRRLLGWETSGYRLVINQPLTQTAHGRCLCVTPADNKIVLSSSEGIDFLDLAHDDSHKTIAPADSPVISMATSPDGRWLATLPKADPGQVSLWQLDEQGNAAFKASWMSSIQFGQGKPCIAFSRDGSQLIHTAGNRTGEQPAYAVMKRFSLPEVKELPSVTIESDHATNRNFAIHTNAIGFGSSELLYVSAHRHLLAWNLQDSSPGKLDLPIPDVVATADLLKMGRSMVGLAIGRSRVAQCSAGFLDSSRQLVVACRIATQIGATPSSDRMSLLPVNSGATCCEFVPDESKLLLGLGDGTVALVGSPEPQLLRQFRAHDDRITAIKMYSEDTVVTASADRTIGIWRLEGERLNLICRLPAAGAVSCMSVIPSPGLLLFLVDGEFRVHCWNLKKLAKRFDEYQLGFSL
jgi:serine/threonine protein kinase/WD40 repeat protein